MSHASSAAHHSHPSHDISGSTAQPSKLNGDQPLACSTTATRPRLHAALACGSWELGGTWDYRACGTAYITVFFPVLKSTKMGFLRLASVLKRHYRAGRPTVLSPCAARCRGTPHRTRRLRPPTPASSQLSACMAGAWGAGPPSYRPLAATSTRCSLSLGVARPPAPPSPVSSVSPSSCLQIRRATRPLGPLARRRHHRPLGGADAQRHPRARLATRPVSGSSSVAARQRRSVRGRRRWRRRRRRQCAW